MRAHLKGAGRCPSIDNEESCEMNRKVKDWRDTNQRLAAKGVQMSTALKSECSSVLSRAHESVRHIYLQRIPLCVFAPIVKFSQKGVLFTAQKTTKTVRL